MTSLNGAARAGQCTTEGHSVRTWLVSPEVCGVETGTVSILQTPARSMVALPDLSTERCSVVLSGEAEATEGGSQSMGAVLHSAGGDTFDLSTSDYPATFLTVAGPAGASRPTAMHRAFHVDDAAAITVHDPDRGFHHMTARILADAEDGACRSFLLGMSSFAPTRGCHALHRHAHAAEFFYIWSGEGVHLTGDGAEHPMVAGDLVYVPANEWHGFRSTGPVTTRALFGYLGASTRQDAGYEVLTSHSTLAHRSHEGSWSQFTQT